MTPYTKRWQWFSVKGGIVNILDFTSYTVPIVTSHHCLCSQKTATDNAQTHELSYIWPMDLPTAV
jgi:hypothetical protein